MAKKVAAKRCKACGKKFKSKWSKQLFCGIACSTKHFNTKYARKRKRAK